MSKSQTVLGDICKITMGQSPDSSTYNTTNIVLPFYQGNADFGELYPKTRIWCSQPQKIAEPENILLSVRAPIGALNIAKEKCCIGRGLAAITPHKNSCFNKYIFYILKYKHNELNVKGTGSTFKAINKSILNNLPIGIYPIDEQKRIADILDKATELIALRKQQIEKLDLLVKSRFIEMFGNPATNSMKWDTPCLSDCLLNIDNGKSFVCENYCRTGDYPAVLKLSAATYGYYNPKENKAVISPKLFITKAEVHAGDLLFTRKNTPDLVGMCAYIFTTPPKLMMPDLIFRLNTKANCNKIFLWQLINLGLFRPRVQSLSGGSAKSMSNISKERLGKMRIPLPPLPLQNEFASLVNHIEKIKSTLQQSLEKLELNYKALMQTYFG